MCYKAKYHFRHPVRITRRTSLPKSSFTFVAAEPVFPGNTVPTICAGIKPNCVKLPVLCKYYSDFP